IIFTSIFSVIFLKRRLTPHQV
ncbi:hypothetical protein KIPB_015413, partial [Kipferlia bialata]